MKKTEVFIHELGRQKRPLGSPIQPEETNRLIEDFRKRLGVSKEDLDLSPRSLKSLDSYLIKYKQKLDTEGQAIVGDELASFFRQIAGYLGEVLVINLKGSWENSPDLFSTSVDIPDEKIIEKGGIKFRSKSIGIVVGEGAAFAWDSIDEGKKTSL